jgi:hypothetical protein
MKSFMQSPMYLVVTDPWELVTEIGSSPLTCSLEDRLSSDLMLLRCDPPLIYRGQTFTYIVVSPRHDHDEFDEMPMNGPLHINGRCVVSRAEFESSSVNRLGTISLIGDLHFERPA